MWASAVAFHVTAPASEFVLAFRPAVGMPRREPNPKVHPDRLDRIVLFGVFTRTKAKWAQSTSTTHDFEMEPEQL